MCRAAVSPPSFLSARALSELPPAATARRSCRSTPTRPWAASGGRG